MIFPNKNEICIKAKSGRLFKVYRDDLITIRDISGGQVADLIAICADNHLEFLSTAATVDANQSIMVGKGIMLYSNKFHPLLEVTEDMVECHDLLHPMCCSEMFVFHYHDQDIQASCFDNIKHELTKHHLNLNVPPSPFNIFMNSQIDAAGNVRIDQPRSKPGDLITMRALVDLVVVVAACAVEKGSCNGGRCTDIGVTITRLKC